MTDVFISYSRKDIAFARILHDALRNDDLETWIDWQDIPPSTDWLAEVYEAIEGADSFVFIISPTSVDSEICGMEIAHAAKNNKRLIPIVINDIDPQIVPDQLAPLNWIFFKEEDELFKTAIEDLIQAIQTDQGWVKEHTRLQTRALEWERKDHESGYLLRGRDLHEAETWLVQAAEKDPQPTSLQTQYVVASRSAATRRQRVTLAAVLLGMILAIALGIVAWTQRNLAVEEGFVSATAQSDAEAAQATAVHEANARATEVVARQTAQAEAETQRDLAISRELAVQSGNQLDRNWDLALLLAIEAFRVDDTQAAGIALREALIHPGRTVQLLKGHAGPVYQAVWNHEGTQILTGGEDGTARIWDAQGGQELALLSGHTQPVVYANWNDDGSRVLTASRDGTARVWDVGIALQDGDSELVILSGHEDEVSFAAWSPDNSRILTSSQDGTVRIWDAESGEELLIFSEHERGVEHAEWHLDEKYILSSDGGTTRLWDSETGEELVTIDRDFDAGSYASWNADGTKLVTTGAFNAEVWDSHTLLSSVGIDFEEETALVKHRQLVPAMWAGQIVHASWNDPGTRIITVSLTGTAEVWNPESGATIVSLSGHTDAVYTGQWDPGGERVLTASADGTARVWNSGSGQQLALLIGHDDAVLSAEWNADGTRVVTASADGTARVWSVTAIDEILTLTNSVQERAFWNDSGSLIVSSGYETQLWDTESGEELAGIEGNFAVWSPEGTRLLTAMPEGVVRIWDAQLFEENESVDPLLDLIGHTDDVRHASWSDDGSRIITLSKDRSIRLWDAASGHQLGLLNIEGDQPDYSEWSPSGESLLVVHPQGLYVWDVPPEDDALEYFIPRFVLDDETETLTHATWSPDGDRIISTGDEGVFIWDAIDGQQLLELTGHTDRVSFAAWSHDGSRILTSGSDNTVRLWDAETGRITLVLAAHNASVDFAAWNSDDMLILSASWDGTARVWDTISGKELAVVSGYFGEVRHVIWSSDDTQFMTTSWGGPVRVFAVPFVNSPDSACAYAFRNLTIEEWDAYRSDQPYQKTCPLLP
jgi:WD40 repeat protein